ncbi:MAG: hypothetical protein ACOC6H_05060, partial [Thermoproteota archaeon]
EDIIRNNRVSYSEGGWYPPLFHSFLAVLLILTGAREVLMVSLIVKLAVATTHVLLLLSTYLLSRRMFGRDVAVSSVLFILPSAPLFEMICWGGYPSLLGLSLIPLIFYIMLNHWKDLTKICLLSLLTFSLILIHQLVAFVFCLLLIPALIITAKGKKKQILVLFAVVLASSLAILGWYADIVLRYSHLVISHVFFEIKEYTHALPQVSLQGFTETFGISLFLAVTGVPLIFVVKREGKWQTCTLLFLWAAVPFFLSQTYLFGLYLPYERFLPFLVIPIAILAGTTVATLARVPKFIKQKICKGKNTKRNTSHLVQATTLIMLVTIPVFQGFISFQRIQSFPEYYDRVGTTGYNTGQWLKIYSPLNSTVVVSQRPGTWLRVISDRNTIEENPPAFGRNQIADTVLGLYYEMENSHTLTREYVIREDSGQRMYLSVYNLWEKVVTISDHNVHISYQEGDGKQVSIPLSETRKEIYWSQKTPNESQLICKYSHNLFTLERKVTMRDDRLATDVRWILRGHQNLTGVRLRVSSYTAPRLNFTEVFIPGVLNWQNPWDRPTYSKPDSWAAIECPPDRLEDNLTALFDADNDILTIWGFSEDPDWLNVGVLENRFIDAIRVGYRFGEVRKEDSKEVSWSILAYSPEEIGKRWDSTTLRQFLRAKEELTVIERDFIKYIERHNIQFVTVHHQQHISKSDIPPILDRIYDSGEYSTYKTKDKGNG